MACPQAEPVPYQYLCVFESVYTTYKADSVGALDGGIHRHSLLAQHHGHTAIAPARGSGVSVAVIESESSSASALALAFTLLKLRACKISASTSSRRCAKSKHGNQQERHD